jgi:hypothetical protein
MPLRVDNKDVWTSHFKQIDRFIQDLHHTNPVLPSQEPAAKRPKKDLRVVSGPRKTGFLGFLINIQPYEAIFNLYVEQKQFIKYILSHKLSQDHLKLMFRTIHSSLGLNNYYYYSNFLFLYHTLCYIMVHIIDNVMKMEVVCIQNAPYFAT